MGLKEDAMSGRIILTPFTLWSVLLFHQMNIEKGDNHNWADCPKTN